MGDGSGIEWTEATWNPLVGCSRTSPGCDNCYAERHAATRLSKVPAYAGLATVAEGWTGEVRYLPERLDQPSRWRRPRRIFVNSMSDLFHPEALGLRAQSGRPVLAEIVAEMVANPRHTFQVLTKRAKNMAATLREPRFALDVNAALMARGLPVMPGGMSQPFDLWARQRHIWWGVSIESQTYAWRARWLLDTPAAVRWVSAEPLLGPLDLTEYLHESTCELLPTGGISDAIGACTCTAPMEDRIDWVVVGGESGPHARPMHPAWARSLRDQCQAAPATRFLFKQWGEWAPGSWATPAVLVTMDGQDLVKVGKHKAGRYLDGRTWDEYPA